MWACDFSNSSGEGNLANLFLKKLKKEKHFIYLIQTKFLKNYPHLKPFLGIIYCWFYFLKNSKVAYINYLPLWNFLIFLLLPPKTIIGPITGGSNYINKSNFNYFLRKFIFPTMYKISNYILEIRFKKIIFSTDLLKKYISRKNLKKSQFNFVFWYFKKQKKVSKTIDFLIYYRKHNNKTHFFPHLFIYNLVRLNYKIHIIGDFLDIGKVKNHGIIDNKKVNNLQKKSNYSIAYGDNIYSIFILECLSNNMKILIDKKYYKNISFLKKDFISCNFKKLKNFKKTKQK